MKYLPLLLLTLFIAIGACNSSPEVIDDLTDRSFELVDQDSVEVTFPDDYKGKYVVMSFIYTNCPDICPLITQNLIKIQKDLDNTDVQFLAVTFDPKRDTPETLSKYKSVFHLDENFNFLTGEEETINAFMDSVRVRTQVSLSTTTQDGTELYFLNHSDKIMVMNPEGKVIIEYGGSQPSVPKLIVQDLNRLLK